MSASRAHHVVRAQASDAQRRANTVINVCADPVGAAEEGT